MEKTNDGIRLNLGSGYTPLPGWTNVDRLNGQEVFPLDYPDQCAETVRASHVLEHFGHKEALAVLQEWVRVLKPGGWLKVAVPNFEWIAREYLRGTEHGPAEGTEPAPIQSYVSGGQQDENDFHRCIYDEGALAELMATAGLVEIQRWESEDPTDCAALPVSLNLMGMRRPVEPAPLPVPEGVTPCYMPVQAREVAAVMSLPRLAFTDNMFCAMQMARVLNIPLERTGGVYWNQGLTNLFEKHLDDGTKYLLTLDYDTVFEPPDVCELLRLMEVNPHADAVCALQVGRDRDSPLFHTGGRWQAGENEAHIPMDALAEDLLPVLTGHFGLTVIRVESLKRLPRPWLHAEPDEEGRWGEGRRDADIALWRKWADCGLTLFLANRVVVGHLQMVVTFPGPQMEAVHQFVSDYLKDGKPTSGVWK